MSSLHDVTDGGSLDTYVALSKNVGAKAGADLIQKATRDMNVFVFGELLYAPNIQKLADGEDTKKYVDLLKIFSYGTYKDYKDQAASLPDLNENQVKKLRMLTVVSLTVSQKAIPYGVMQEALEMSEIRELEDIIIECMYANLIVGKLDQRNRVLLVKGAMGRDTRPGDIDHLYSTIQQWLNTSVALGETLRGRVEYANEQVSQDKRMVEEHTERVKLVKEAVQQHVAKETASGADFGSTFESLQYNVESQSGRGLTRRPGGGAAAGRRDPFASSGGRRR